MSILDNAPPHNAGGGSLESAKITVGRSDFLTNRSDDFMHQTTRPSSMMMMMPPSSTTRTNVSAPPTVSTPAPKPAFGDIQIQAATHAELNKKVDQLRRASRLRGCEVKEVNILKETETKILASITLGVAEATSTPEELFSMRYGTAAKPQATVSLTSNGQVVKHFKVETKEQATMTDRQDKDYEAEMAMRAVQIALFQAQQEKEKVQKELNDLRQQKDIQIQNSSQVQELQQALRLAKSCQEDMEVRIVEADARASRFQKEAAEAYKQVIVIQQSYLDAQKEKDLIKGELSTTISKCQATEMALLSLQQKESFEARRQRFDTIAIVKLRKARELMRLHSRQLKEVKEQMLMMKRNNEEEMKKIFVTMTAFVSGLMSSLSRTNSQESALMQVDKSILVSKLLDTATQYKQMYKRMGILHNIVQDLRGNVRVFCRVRPLSSEEVRYGSAVVVRDDGTIAVCKNESVSSSSSPSERWKGFMFDRAFAQEATQQDVFEETEPLIRSAVEGFNVCIFAYGQTGSGKTHTMMGSVVLPQQQQQLQHDENTYGSLNKGLVFRTLDALFVQKSQLNRVSKNLSVSLSIFEIYNEILYDVLSPDAGNAANGGPSKLLVLGDPGEGIVISGLTSHSVGSAQEGERLLYKGMLARSTAATKMNDQSSRSHLLVLFHLRVEDDSINKEPAKTSKLYMIDLAGSEDVLKSGASGVTLKEASHINRSLSALHDVMAALAIKSSSASIGASSTLYSVPPLVFPSPSASSSPSSATPAANTHVPYRNSKLTHVLSDCLNGRAKTLMFVMVSPSALHWKETTAALMFASRCKNIALGPLMKGEGGSLVKEGHKKKKHLNDGVSPENDKQLDILSNLEYELETMLFPANASTSFASVGVAEQRFRAQKILSKIREMTRQQQQQQQQQQLDPYHDGNVSEDANSMMMMMPTAIPVQQLNTHSLGSIGKRPSLMDLARKKYGNSGNSGKLDDNFDTNVGDEYQDNSNNNSSSSGGGGGAIANTLRQARLAVGQQPKY